MNRELQWGETPWDDMPREQLMREVQRMYDALVSARSVMALASFDAEGHPFWGEHGSGRRALRKADQALEPYPNEPAYRSFFRYATDLLFRDLGSNWRICDKCLAMVASTCGNPPPTTCYTLTCSGAPLRPICWDDLKPQR